MANEKRVNRPRVFTLGGYRISAAANEITENIKRELVEGACYEDPGSVNFKGPYSHEASLKGYGTEAEVRILEALAADPQTHLLDLWQSDPEASPVAAVGDPALFFALQISELSLPRQKGAMNAWSFNAKSGGGYPYPGVVAYTNVGDTPLGAGTVTSTPINLGALAAGEILALLFQVVDPPGLTGTTPTVDADLESDALVGFASPVTQASITQVVPSGVPSSQLILIDGDVDPTPGELWWRLSITVAGTAPGATILAAICKRSKT